MLILLIVIFTSIPEYTLAYTVNSKEFKEVVKQLDMQGHADHELSTCSVKKVYHEEILEMLNNGNSTDEIIQYYLSEYGQAALREPGSDKSGLVAWGMPIIGSLIGIIIVIYWVKKWKIKSNKDVIYEQPKWSSEIEFEIVEKTFDEERRKHF